MRLFFSWQVAWLQWKWEIFTTRSSTARSATNIQFLFSHKLSNQHYEEQRNHIKTLFSINILFLLCQIFFVPVIAIVVSYSKILMVMSRYGYWSKFEYSVSIWILRRSSNILSQFSQNEEENRSNAGKKKNLVKALKMSSIHVVMFVLSWTP